MVFGFGFELSWGGVERISETNQEARLESQDRDKREIEKINKAKESVRLVHLDVPEIPITEAFILPGLGCLWEM